MNWNPFRRKTKIEKGKEFAAKGGRIIAPYLIAFVLSVASPVVSAWVIKTYIKDECKTFCGDNANWLARKFLCK